MLVIDAVHAVRAALSGDSWPEALEEVKESPLFRVAGSRNPVFVPTEVVPADARVVLKVSPDAEREASLLRQVKRGVPAIRVPRVLYADGTLLVTEYIEGEPLNARLQKGDLSLLAEAVQQLAQIHARMPQLWTPTNLKSRLKARLHSPHVNIPGQLVEDILGMMLPVIDILDAGPRAAYLDRVPENVLVTSGGELVQIDFEGAEWCSPMLDVANLLAYSDTVPWQTQLELLRLYTSEPHSVSSTEYATAVIYRQLCYVAAWSKPERTHLQQERVPAINRALLASSGLCPVLGLRWYKSAQVVVSWIKAHVENSQT